MRIALVHDWLTGMRGGERVLEAFCDLYPHADLYTLVHVPGSTSESIENRRIIASPLSVLPGISRHYRKLLPLFPWAIGSLRGPMARERYDLVVSCSHAVAKAIPLPPGTPHLCYCLTPMRYVWDQADSYLGQGAFRAVASPVVAWLRRFDRATSSPEQVTRFVGISSTVVDRIDQHYGRRATLVFPPVDTQRIRPDGEPPDDYYLLVGGFVPYKREDLAIEAFARLGRRLVVVGDGPTRARLQASAPANVVFEGRVSDAELARHYARCRALIYPQEEDFGIIALEAQAAGRPVIAYGRGGARDTIVPLQAEGAALDASRLARPPTGIWFDTQRPEALANAVEQFEKYGSRFRSGAIRAWAERFGHQRFREEMEREVEETLAER